MQVARPQHKTSQTCMVDVPKAWERNRCTGAKDPEQDPQCNTTLLLQCLKPWIHPWHQKRLEGMKGTDPEDLVDLPHGMRTDRSTRARHTRIQKMTHNAMRPWIQPRHEKSLEVVGPLTPGAWWIHPVRRDKNQTTWSCLTRCNSHSSPGSIFAT